MRRAGQGNPPGAILAGRPGPTPTIHDRRTGPAFIKVCCYAPYPVKVWCNGHEIARRAALAEGIAVTPLASGFAATDDPARLQELCDLVQAGRWRPESGVKGTGAVPVHGDIRRWH